MLVNKNQVIVSGLLGLGLAGFATATALQFNDRIEYRVGNRIEYAPAWLVPAKAEFKGIERGYGGLKILLSLLATGGMVTVMLIARNEEEQEPIRQKIKGYQKQAYEFGFAAESAYLMAQTQMKYKKLLDADEVAFEGEIEAAYCESLGINTSQQQAALTGTATLDSTTNPSDKIEDVKVTAIESGGNKIPNLTWYPSVLIYGSPGSGKTYFAAEEVAKRKTAGHRIIVLDPHAAYGAWSGCEVIGGGMNYGAIDAKLAWFAEEVGKRYKRVQAEPNPRFEPLTFVCDEFTRWGNKCANSTEFFEQLVTDIRKVEMFGVIISHTRTLAGLANAKGFASLRDEAFLEIEILGEQGEGGRATPKFEAMVKLPGESLGDRTLVALAKHSAPGVENSAANSNQNAPDSRAYLEKTWGMEFDLSKPELEPFEPVAEPLNLSADETCGDTEPKYTLLELSREQALNLIKSLRCELNQTQIIERLWACKKGGSADWKAAYTQFKELMGE
ncbi:type IV secretory system conjugative DNA transfer family protein [Microcoleus sp. bin38.metabat.b11b12b14.051]|uniref:type IV secretory system conjugative DNA transfer family protein n=1 Tax=Microcoleus sp. bin38.metabat.b11b12b14.051 TaxID=2742709 RepID=UPI0025DEA3B4|nr:type IV secretory system conjugative DNA transfer family protein [Microcoleus sp. bin38.metabat.b11b12b14.051]